MKSSFSLTQFRQKARAHKAEGMERVAALVGHAERITTPLLEETEAEVWAQTDCLACAGCCRYMSPELNAADVKRIASYLRLSPKVFTQQYLLQTDRPNVWVMNSQPCPLLNLHDNTCRVYPVRPADCAGFPHLDRQPFPDFAHMHQSNQLHCPATALMMEKLFERLQDLLSSIHPRTA